MEQYPKMCVMYFHTSLVLFKLHFSTLSPQDQRTQHQIPYVQSLATSQIYLSVMVQGATRQTNSDKQ